MAATDSIVRYIITPDPNEKRYDLVIAVDKDDNGKVTINHKLLIDSSDQIGLTDMEAQKVAGSISEGFSPTGIPNIFHACTWRTSTTLSCALVVVSITGDRSEENALFALGEAYLSGLTANGPLISHNPQSI